VSGDASRQAAGIEAPGAPAAAAAAARQGQRDVTRPLPFRRAARAVFELALDGMFWSRRSLMMAILLGLPLVFGVLYRAVLVARLPPTLSGLDLYKIVVVFYYVRWVLPLTALFYATALIADEVEGRTLTYLLTRPVRRGAILAGKFAAYVATTLALTLPAVLLTFFVLATSGGTSGLGAEIPSLLRDLGVIALGFLAYGALFALLGVLLRRPLIPGLLFVFVWELLANLPGYLPRLTVTAYVRSLIRHRPAFEGFAEIFGNVLPAALCLQVLLGMTLVCLLAASRIFLRREYVMEQ
jgi:ABC-type transport system involved in multi-copper enzyme maturation permease subunit